MLSKTLITATAGSAAAGSEHWIGLYGGASNDYGYHVAIGSSGSIYFGGDGGSAGAGTEWEFAKLDQYGSIQWQRSLGGAGAEDFNGLAIDSSENVYIGGYTNSAGPGGYSLLVAKYNSSGVIQWQRTLGGTSNDFGMAITADSSGNSYITGQVLSAGAGYYDFVIAKYNTSGSLQWQRTLGTSGDERARAIAVDSSGNVYVGGGSPWFFTALIAKYNSSGTLQWQKTLSLGNVDALAADSSGNVYATGRDTGGGPDLRVWKLNSSGTLQWQRTLAVSGNDSRGYGITVDSSSNVYAVGFADGIGSGGTRCCIIAKYNSSGTIQWQRTLTTTSSELLEDVAVDNLGNICVVGYSNTGGSGNNMLIARLPDDGSLTGTYGSWTYAASSLTDAAGSATDGSGSLSSASSSLTDSSSSLTDAATSLTISVTDL